MDFMAIWNRIDQLERLVLSQSQEIENLKRLIILGNESHHNRPNNTPAVPQHQQPVNYSTYNPNQNLRPGYLAIRNQSNHQQTVALPANFTSVPPPNNPLFQPQMNSFIHPQSAIPPVAIRPSVNVASNTPALPPNLQVPSQESQKLIQNLDRLLTENRPPPSSRWSMAASVVANNSNTNDNIQREFGNYITHQPQNSSLFGPPNGILGEPNDDESDEANKKHERQKFVESFGQWRNRYRDEKMSDESNCENKLPCDDEQRQPKRHDPHWLKQQVQTNNTAAVLVTPDKAERSPGELNEGAAKSPAIACLRMYQRATESFPGPSGDLLTDYIVGELEPFSEDLDPSKVKDIVDKDPEAPYIYITFNKTIQHGHFWRPIKDTLSPQKRKHCTTPVGAGVDRIDKLQKTGKDLIRTNKRIYLPKKG